MLCGGGTAGGHVVKRICLSLRESHSISGNDPRKLLICFLVFLNIPLYSTGTQQESYLLVVDAADQQLVSLLHFVTSVPIAQRASRGASVARLLVPVTTRPATSTFPEPADEPSG